MTIRSDLRTKLLLWQFRIQKHYSMFLMASFMPFPGSATISDNVCNTFDRKAGGDRLRVEVRDICHFHWLKLNFSLHKVVHIPSALAIFWQCYFIKLILCDFARNLHFAYDLKKSEPGRGPQVPKVKCMLKKWCQAVWHHFLVIPGLDFIKNTILAISEPVPLVA